MIENRPVFPILYRDFEIYPIYVDFGWSHPEFDGAEDSDDNRCGTGKTIEDCKKSIDYWYEE